ncbi:hypothetical protein ACFWIY_34300 [Streptomyces sioyaensis]|uniref:hypothetical protein n=1 Tax=Streptomyces sioyaensis TaxID=67364 RepID=UPI003667252B
MRSIQRLASAATAIALTAAGLILTSGSAHAATCFQSRLPLPDATCQPGAYNPAVTQSTIKSTICVPGWTKTVRPPVSYITPLKIKQIGQYGYSDSTTADYEEDHVRHEALHYRARVRGLSPPGCRSSPVKLRAA